VSGRWDQIDAPTALAAVERGWFAEGAPTTELSGWHPQRVIADRNDGEAFGSTCDSEATGQLVRLASPDPQVGSGFGNGEQVPMTPAVAGAGPAWVYRIRTGSTNPRVRLSCRQEAPYRHRRPFRPK
jgi:hypothetical protein